MQQIVRTFHMTAESCCFPSKYDKWSTRGCQCGSSCSAQTVAKHTMSNPKRTAAIIVAAGRGLRAGTGGPKQYRSIGGRTVLARAMEPFCVHPEISAVQPVRNPDDADIFD